MIILEKNYTKSAGIFFIAVLTASVVSIIAASYWIYAVFQ